MSENELIVRAEEAKLEALKIQERMSISEDLAGVTIGPEGLICTNGRSLRRMAVFFSEAEIWPKQFRGKPANCFVALTLAVRLKCDPTMLACNLYEAKGNWGMESKLALALARQAGVFSKEPWHTFEGEGENYTCTCHCIRASDGAELTESLSRSEVRKWGWYDPKGESKQPSIWMLMEERMFKYRTTDWLIRSYFPWVTMGLLSRYEVEEIESGNARPEPAATNPKAEKKHALPAPNAAATDRPRDDGALGLVGVGAGEKVETTGAAQASADGLSVWLAKVADAKTKEEVNEIWKGIPVVTIGLLGPEKMEAVKQACLFRAKELSDAKKASDGQAQAGAKVDQVAATGGAAAQDGGAASAPVKKSRGRPRKATDAEIASEQAKPIPSREPAPSIPEDQGADPVEDQSADDRAIGDANEYLPAQWSNRQIDECVSNIISSNPGISEHAKKVIDSLAANRKKRIA